jgi:3-hydroxyacyl-[acyl-carrier-protein] dehydratase
MSTATALLTGRGPAPPPAAPLGSRIGSAPVRSTPVRESNPVPLLAFGADEIRTMLPHRWPMLLIDRAYDVRPGRTGYGIKNVSIAEPYFAGHYPEQSIMPGVLMIEAMAQLTAVVLGAAWAEAAEAAEPDAGVEAGPGRVGYLGAVRQMKFNRLVVPGDQLIMYVEVGRTFERLTPVNVRATVGSELAVKGSLTVSERGLGGESGFQ